MYYNCFKTNYQENCLPNSFQASTNEGLSLMARDKCSWALGSKSGKTFLAFPSKYCNMECDGYVAHSSSEREADRSVIRYDD